MTNSGTGAGYYDRGAFERRDTITFGPFSPEVTGPAPDSPVSQAPVGADLTVTAGATSTWGGTLTYTFDFGDGSPKVTNTTGVTTHAYTAVGSYTLNIDVTSSYGTGTDTSEQITIVDAPPHPVITVTPTGAMSISGTIAGSTDPWGFDSAEVDFGDGNHVYLNDPSHEPTFTHTYAKPGTYTVTATLDDPGLDNAQATATYTTKGSDFTAYGPARVLDTRKGTGTGGVVGPVGAKQSIQVPIGGTGTIPADATAVALNVTETDAKGGGYITAYPTGGTRPSTSNLDYEAGQTKAANVIVGLGTDGEVTLTNTAGGSVSLIVDVTGYFTKTNAAGYEAVAPTRVLDTRNGNGLAGGKPAKVGANASIPLTVTGGRPDASEVKAVVLNLTVTNTTGAGYITAYPDGTARPVSSSLDYPAGHTVANTLVVPVSANGKIDLFNASGTPVDLIADVEGYFSVDPAADGAFVSVAPTRLYDSRKSSPLPASGTATITPSALDTQDQLPSDASAFVYNLTVTQPATGGYFTVYPAGTNRPIASNVDFNAGETAENSVIAASGTANGAGADTFFNASGGNAHFIVDLFGYFTDH